MINLYGLRFFSSQVASAKARWLNLRSLSINCWVEVVAQDLKVISGVPEYSSVDLQGVSYLSVVARVRVVDLSVVSLLDWEWVLEHNVEDYSSVDIQWVACLSAAERVKVIVLSVVSLLDWEGVLENNLKGSLEMEDGVFLEWWVTSILESGVRGSWAFGILEKLARGSLKIDMSVHSIEDSSLSSSWGRRKLRTGGSWAENPLVGGSNR